MSEISEKGNRRNIQSELIPTEGSHCKFLYFFLWEDLDISPCRAMDIQSPKDLRPNGAEL